MITSINFLASKAKVVSLDASGVVKIWRRAPGESDDEEKITEIFVGGDMLVLPNEKDFISTVSSSSKELVSFKLKTLHICSV